MARLAVLGHPVSHSRSPAMQNAALAAAGLADWQYEAIDVDPEAFADLVRGLPGQGFAGVNVTVPHKEAALAVADEASPAAAAIGAANTLTFVEGRILAENTDAPGLVDALGEEAGGLAGRPPPPPGGGGGGGGGGCALGGGRRGGVVPDPPPSTAAAPAAPPGGRGSSPRPHRGIDPGRFEVIVNASAAGLGGGDGLADLPLDPGGFRPGQTVVDMVYGEGPGTLIEAAERAGAATVDGLEILVRQGARSFEIWTGRQPDLEVMRRAARA